MDQYSSTEPISLELACLDFIKTALDNAERSHGGCAVLKNIRILPGPFVGSIFEYLGKSGCISDFKLKLLQAASEFPLKKLYLCDIKDDMYGSSLQGFSKYKLKEIVLKFDRNNRHQPDLTDLWEAFKGSENSLKVFKLYCYPIYFNDGRHLFNLATKFPNLEIFCIHTFAEYCDLDNDKWGNLLNCCPSLRSIEVFAPYNNSQISLDTSIFSGRIQIQSLSLPTLLNFSGVLHKSHGLMGLIDLQSLCHLDISVDDEPENNNQQVAKDRAERRKYVIEFVEMLEDKSLLPNIISLDLSGIKGLHTGHIDKFLKSHRKIMFLGLCLLEVEYTIMSSVADQLINLQITGTFLEKQILLTLKVYPNRALYIREALKNLFVMCGDWSDRRPEVIELVLRALRDHSLDHLLQLAATACLYNLTKNDQKLKPVPPLQLVEAAELSLQALKRFRSSDKRQIMKNCLLIFCNDKLLHDPKFKRFDVSRVCLDCMLVVSESLDRHITRMAVSIVSVLACKITSQETSELTGVDEMKLLLSIARARLSDERIDGTLKFDLSALWNLTDESPKACHLFVDHGGLDLYVDLLKAYPVAEVTLGVYQFLKKVFSNDQSIQTKVLGLLNNIAEVSELHESLVVDDLMAYVGELILSEEKSVSYFAGGIIANLAYGWSSKYQLQVCSKQELLVKLDEAIKRWGTLDSEIVTYRSFKPFLGLLDSFDLAPVQHFSLWAIHHVCTLNSERYKDLMTIECVKRLDRLRNAPFSTTEQQREMVDEIFNACSIKTEGKMEVDTL